MKNKIGLIAGSFDPPTLGHLDIIERAARLCDRLLVGLAQNSQKTNPLFTILERQAMLAEVCHGIPNVKIVEIPGLVVEYAKHHKVDFLIRGLRSTADFELEKQMAFANKKLGDIETFFLIGSPQYAHISSTLINEIALGGYRLLDFVSPVIEDAVHLRITMKMEMV